jgi:predicted TIM-barrel fold metal-dependent hydrolase
MDEAYIGHANSVDPKLSRMPSQIIRDQVHCSLQNDVGSSVAARSGVGLRALLFATDYPHSEGTFPFTNKVIEKMREQNPDLTAEELVEVLGGNAVKIFTRAGLRPKFEARTREFLGELH